MNSNNSSTEDNSTTTNIQTKQKLITEDNEDSEVTENQFIQTENDNLKKISFTEETGNNWKKYTAYSSFSNKTCKLMIKSRIQGKMMQKLTSIHTEQDKTLEMEIEEDTIQMMELLASILETNQLLMLKYEAPCKKTRRPCCKQF